LGLKRVLERMGVSTWYAPADVAFGEEWPDTLDAAIHGSAVFLVLLTRDSLESRHVRSELERAVARREIDRDNFLLVPIAHGIAPADLPETVRSLQAVDLTSQLGFVDHVIRLADRITNFVESRRLPAPVDRRRTDRRRPAERRRLYA
jgi:hypothetical protein